MIYLEAVMKDVLDFGGRIAVRERRGGAGMSVGWGKALQRLEHASGRVVGEACR